MPPDGSPPNVSDIAARTPAMTQSPATPSAAPFSPTRRRDSGPIDTGRRGVLHALGSFVGRNGRGPWRSGESRGSRGQGCADTTAYGGRVVDFAFDPFHRQTVGFGLRQGASPLPVLLANRLFEGHDDPVDAVRRRESHEFVGLRPSLRAKRASVRHPWSCRRCPEARRLLPPATIAIGRGDPTSMTRTRPSPESPEQPSAPPVTHPLCCWHGHHSDPM